MNKRITDIVNLIRKNKQLPEYAPIQTETSLHDDLGFDSFDLAELTVRIEDEFGVDIFEDGIVTTIGEILDKLPDEQ